MPSFDEYVAGSILVNNEFGITEVKGLESIRSLGFDRDIYEQVRRMIVKGRLNALEGLVDDEEKPFHFLEIMSFKDQFDKTYIVTVYDSLALEQDTEVIAIFPG